MPEQPPPLTVFPHGRDDSLDGLPQVLIRDRGCELLLTFEDTAGNGAPLEIRLAPGEEKLEARVLRRFVPAGDLYVNAARTALHWWGRPEAQRELLGQVEALRELGAPGRALNPGFYVAVAAEYRALVAEGEPHPIKTMAASHHRTVSAVSRWVTEARRRGLIKETDQ